MTESSLQIETQDYITTITLNRPEKRNALTYDMFREIQSVMPQLADDPATRVVVIRGAGTRAFSSGMDLNEVLDGVAKDPTAPLDHELIHGAMQAVEEHPNPVIAMVNGDAFAGGCELALHCDFRLMVESAQIGMPLAKRGLMIPFPLVQKLVQMVGPVATTEILLQGAALSAHRACELKLINQVVSADRLEADTMALATELAANAPLSVRGFKAAIRAALPRGGVGQERVMHEQMVQAMASADAREGLQAFLEKRVPHYTGT